MALDEDHPHLFIRISDSGWETGEHNQLCSIVRGLLHANGQSNGQTLKNPQFKSGRVIDFGGGPAKLRFVASVKRFLKRSIRENIDMRDG